MPGRLDLIPDLEDRLERQRILRASAKVISSSAAPGSPPVAILREKAPPPPPDWGRFAATAPALAEALSDPNFAVVASEDTGVLESVERWFAGFTEAANPKRVVADHDRLMELVRIGEAEMAGTATPEMILRRKALSEEQEPREWGWVAEAIGGAADQIPLIAGALPMAVQGATMGAIAGFPAGGVGAVPGAKVGFSLGLTAGMVGETYRIERALAFNEYRELGADFAAARFAAEIVGLVNGGLEIFPASKVFNLIPGLEAAVKKYGVRDLMRRMIRDTTARAALARLAGRVAQAGLIEGLTEGAQEFATILGALGSGAVDDLPENTLDRTLEAARQGALVGGVFGTIHGGLAARGDFAEVARARNRRAAFEALGGLAAESKVREAMPGDFKAFVNRVRAEHGGDVETVSAPAGKLRELFQEEGITEKAIERDMPEVARQLRTAAPGTEVVVPIADFAAHVAPLQGFAKLTDDLRLGDGLTAREAAEAEKMATEMAEGDKATEKPAEVAPARRVYDDVYAKVSAVQPATAEAVATLWAHFAEAMGSRRGKDAWTYYSQRTVEFGVDFDREEGLTVLDQASPVGSNRVVRGAIAFDDARSLFRITLTGHANLSTLFHESGHAFLEFLRMDALEDEVVARELQVVREWLGAKDGEDLTPEQLEQFARGFEQYLWEGKAPSDALRGVFRAVKTWLRYVYRAIRGLGVELSDEIRFVMDRMLATDEEIARALAESPGPMPPTPGMTVEEHRAYLRQYAEAIEKVREDLEHEALAALRKTMGEERERVRAEVEAAAAKNRVYNAIEALLTGTRSDGGTVDPEIAGKKLSRAAVWAYIDEGPFRFVTEATKQKFLRLTAEDGVDPDVAAPYLGFDDAQDLIEAIAETPGRSKWVREETERRMRERYPESDVAALAEGAVKALHHEALENVLWVEFRALDKVTGKATPRTVREAYRLFARRRVREMSGLELIPSRFERAERKAEREWFDAVKAKDVEAARAAKLAQIENFYLAREVRRAREESEAIVRYLRKFETAREQRKLARAGRSYLGGVLAILEGIDLRRRTNRELARRESLASFLAALEAEDGAVLAIPEEIRSEAGLRNYRQMTLAELETVRDAVKNLEHLARLKNRIFDGRARRDLEETAQRAAAHIEANAGHAFRVDEGKEKQNRDAVDRILAFRRRRLAEVKKIEFLCREMDGGKTAGFLHELLFQPFATAEARENEWVRKLDRDLRAPFKALPFRAKVRLGERVEFLGVKMRRRDVLAIALNMGNEGNRRKLLLGYAYRKTWTEENILRELGAVLNDTELDLVEHVWRVVGSLWPEIEELSRRTTGVLPPKVEATPFEVNGRRLSGGYYPIVYDKDNLTAPISIKEIARRQEADLFVQSFLAPGVSKGFTEARTQFYAPIQLDLSVVPRHLSEVVHYLTHYEPVRAVDRLTRHPAVRRAITEAFGPEVYGVIRPWLAVIARGSGYHVGTTTNDRIFRYMRVGYAVHALGLKMRTAMIQFLGVSNTVKEIGVKYTAMGALEFLKEIRGVNVFSDVEARSPQVRDFNLQMADTLLGRFERTLGAFASFPAIQEKAASFSLILLALFQKTVNAVTWYGAHAKAEVEGHARPEEYADSVVRLSQMGEGPKDKAMIQWSNELNRQLTVLMSYFLVLHNQLHERSPKKGAGRAVQKAAHWWWLVLLPAFLEAWMAGSPDDAEDFEDAAKKYGLEVAGYYARTKPLGSIAFDAVASEYEPRYAPWINTMVRGLAAATRDGELSEGEKRAVGAALGTALRQPVGGVQNGLKYLEAYTNGELEEPVKALLFQTPRMWED